MEKAFPLFVAAAALLFLVIAFALPFFFNSLPAPEMPTNTSILDLNFSESTPLKLHIHPYLEIEILGENRTIPAGIGISDSGQRIIHTHDSSGKIHVESPWDTQFYLKDFFHVWGERFDRHCIFDYCEDGNHTLKAYVNGTQSDLYGDIPLEDGETIRIEYS